MSKVRFCNSKHGRRSKFKWPDTFLIESSGRREIPESIADSKAREARRQNATQAKQSPSSTPEEEDDDIVDPDSDVEVEHRFTENDTGSDQDISDDEEFEDSIIDETSELFANHRERFIYIVSQKLKSTGSTSSKSIYFNTFVFFLYI